MKVIIAGSRTFEREIGGRAVQAALWLAEGLGWKLTEVVCGEARGIDTCGRLWAEHHGIPVKSFPADWDGKGREAGFIRNVQMAAYADALIAITNGSPGTRHMIQSAKAKGLKVLVIEMPKVVQVQRDISQLPFVEFETEMTIEEARRRWPR
jgi:hypothetical protein